MGWSSDGRKVEGTPKMNSATDPRNPYSDMNNEKIGKIEGN